MIPHSKPYIDKKNIQDVNLALLDKNISRGNGVDSFERELANYLNIDNVYCVSSGTAALVVALKTLNISIGDEVICPTYVCDSLLIAIKFMGAIPILCDISPNWVMSVAEVRKKITMNTKAVIIVHIFGIIIDIGEFKSLGVKLIEDCSQALTNQVQNLSDIKIYSFHATKCLAAGEGGAVGVINLDLIKSLNSVKIDLGNLFPMSDLQAALGSSQLKQYDIFLSRRNEIAEYYLKNLPSRCISKIDLLKYNTIFFRFPITVNEDYMFISSYFLTNEIVVRKGVDQLLHRKLGLSDINFENAVSLYNSTISIPIYPSLTDKEVFYIIDKVRGILN